MNARSRSLCACVDPVVVLLGGLLPTANAQPGKVKINDDPNKVALAELDRGNTAADRKEWEKAVGHYARALQQQPDLLPALVNRGRVQLVRGKLDDAVADFTRACELAPKVAVVHAWLAAACLDKAQHAAAITAADKALALDAKLALGYFVRGTVFIHKGELKKALEDLNEAARLAPNDAVIYNNRGVAHEKLGDQQKARADFALRDKLNGKTTAADDKTKGPAKQKAWQALKEAEEEYRLANALVEVHENRIRTMQSIRTPPGVARPWIDPVPLPALQRRQMAWLALQEARKSYEQTP